LGHEKLAVTICASALFKPYDGRLYNSVLVSLGFNVLVFKTQTHAFIF